MEELKEKKPKQLWQNVWKAVVIAFFITFFVFSVKNFRQIILGALIVLLFILFFFGKRTRAFWEQPWRFETFEDFGWAIAAILGVAYLIIRAFI